MSMINSVRETVLSILSKENRGYVTPIDFNLFAKQAQLEIFEEYFEKYTSLVSKSLIRRTHSEYADMPKYLREKIDVFSDYKPMTYSSNKFSLPSDGYRLTSVISNKNEVEEVYKSQLAYLHMSDMTEPTISFPVYVRIGRDIEIHPLSIISGINCYYIRKPKDPIWTYEEIGGLIIFNSSKSGYKDFEIHPSDETNIILKILEYCGLSIREVEVNKILQEKQVVKNQTENR